MPQHKITITSDVLADSYDGSEVTGDWAKEYVAGAEQLIVPGVTAWDNVTATREDDKLTIVANITTEDRVTGNAEYNGDEVSEEFVRSYILGADAYWLAPDVLTATEVTFA